MGGKDSRFAQPNVNQQNHRDDTSTGRRHDCTPADGEITSDDTTRLKAIQKARVRDRRFYA